MINRHIKILNIKGRKCFFILLLLLFSDRVVAQITVYPENDFNFGAFYQGSQGGTINISTAGVRSATGDIILMNTGAPYSQAAFEIEAPVGSVISITNGPDTILTGSNGGTVTLHLGAISPASPFNTNVAPPGRTRFQMAGTLIVGDSMASPPGNYRGTFSFTFHQE